MSGNIIFGSTTTYITSLTLLRRKKRQIEDNFSPIFFPSFAQGNPAKDIRLALSGFSKWWQLSWFAKSKNMNDFSRHKPYFKSIKKILLYLTFCFQWSPLEWLKTTLQIFTAIGCISCATVISIWLSHLTAVLTYMWQSMIGSTVIELLFYCIL